MPTLSVVVLTKNEAANVPPLLKSLEGMADELVVVDTGSTDDTVALLRSAKTSYPITLLERTFEPFHFGIARNYSLTGATKDYVLMLGADERPGESFKRNVKAFLKDKKPMVVEMPRIDDRVPHYKETQLVLFKNGEGIKWGEDDDSRIHERLIHPGAPVLFPEPFYHFQGKNHWLANPSKIYWQLAMEVARTPNTRGFIKEALHAPLGFFYKFRQVYVRREAYKDGWDGFAFAVLKGWYAFLFHLRVALKPQKPRK